MNTEDFTALRDWVHRTPELLEEDEDLELLYLQTPAPLRVLKLRHHQGKLLVLYGIDEEGKWRAVLTTSPVVQLEARSIAAEDPGERRTVGFEQSSTEPLGPLPRG